VEQNECPVDEDRNPSPRARAARLARAGLNDCLNNNASKGDCHMLLKINGRTRFFEHIESVTMDRRGHYTVKSVKGTRTHHVEGGRAAGGSPRDWFLDGDHLNKSIRCTSLMDALRIINNL
jgi:hypothetical protein